MKILMITHILPFPPGGGCRLRNFNLIKQVAQHHELHLLTLYRKTHQSDQDQVTKSIAEMKKYCTEVHAYPIPGEYSRLKYVWTLLLNLFSSDPYSAALYHSAALTTKVSEMLKLHQYDAVEIGEIAMLNYAKLAPGLPKLLVHHNVESQLLYRRAKVASNPIMRTYINLQAARTERFERLAGDMIEAHTTCSALDREMLRKINPNIDAVVVPNGVDTDFFRSTGDEIIPNSMIFAGGLSWLPNRDAMQLFMSEIWPILKDKVPNVTMTVVGGGPPEELTAMARKDSNFKVTGFVVDVRPLITRAAVYVVPIRVGGGTRLKILDAMAMGKAIVSHSIGAEGIELTHGKDVLIADSSEDIAAAIISLFGDSQRRQELEQMARLKAEEQYDWRVIAPTLLKTYDWLKTQSSHR